MGILQLTVTSCSMEFGSSTPAGKHFFIQLSTLYREHQYIVICFLIHVQASGRQELTFGWYVEYDQHIRRAITSCIFESYNDLYLETEGVHVEGPAYELAAFCTSPFGPRLEYRYFFLAHATTISP